MRYEPNPAGELRQQRLDCLGVMSEAYLVQILLPKKTGNGELVTQQWFDNFLKELTAWFGGATSFLRAPGQGLWRDVGATERDTIAIVEVMTEELAQDYWRKLRERLESELSQEEIVIRAQQIIRL
jgi:hypothetical protein